MYKVIKFFTDMQDNDFPYDVGDVFPRENTEATAERIEELETSKNRQGEPLIKKVASPKKSKNKTNDK